MKGHRDDLNSKIKQKIQALDRDSTQEFINKLCNEKGFPDFLAADIFHLTKDLGEFSDFEIFCIADVMGLKRIINQYYVDVEIKRYKDEKYYAEPIDDEIEFEMTEIEKDVQYIGKCTVKQLMMLRSNGKINYNKNTQRVMTFSIRNGGEFRITINWKQVDAIYESMISGRYISNTLTLNINDESEMKMKYKNGKLFLRDIDSFDMTDGFHRYLAMARAYDLDHNWDYPMELRITRFTESKAKQFIHQEDQKTPMSRIASKSMNQYSEYNKVIERVNMNSLLAGEVYVHGKLDGSVMAEILSRTSHKIKDKTDTIRISKQLTQYVDNVVEEDTNLLNVRWSRYQIALLMYGFDKDIKPSEIVKAINWINTPAAEEQKKKLRSVSFYKVVQKWAKEVFDYV